MMPCRRTTSRHPMSTRVTTACHATASPLLIMSPHHHATHVIMTSMSPHVRVTSISSSHPMPTHAIVSSTSGPCLSSPHPKSRPTLQGEVSGTGPMPWNTVWAAYTARSSLCGEGGVSTMGQITSRGLMVASGPNSGSCLCCKRKQLLHQYRSHGLDLRRALALRRLRRSG